jgi:hypothetical protein
MPIHRLWLSFLGAVLVSTPVLAQPSQTTAPAPQTSAGGWATQLQPDQWRASDLEGLGVYSSNNGDKIGDISELIFDNSGKVQVVVIGLAGIWELANTALQCRSTRSGSSTSRASTPPAQRRARLDWREPAPEAAPSLHRQQPEQQQCQQAPTVRPLGYGYEQCVCPCRTWSARGGTSGCRRERLHSGSCRSSDERHQG